MIAEDKAKLCIKVVKVSKSRGGKYEPIDPAPITLRASYCTPTVNRQPGFRRKDS